MLHFLVIQPYLIYLKIFTYILGSLLTICLHNKHALSTTAYFLKTEILTKVLLDIQRFEFPS